MKFRFVAYLSQSLWIVLLGGLLGFRFSSNTHIRKHELLQRLVTLPLIHPDGVNPMMVFFNGNLVDDKLRNPAARRSQHLLLARKQWKKIHDCHFKCLQKEENKLLPICFNMELGDQVDIPQTHKHLKFSRMILARTRHWQGRGTQRSIDHQSR